MLSMPSRRSAFSHPSSVTSDALVLFVDGEVAGIDLDARFRAGQLLAAGEFGNEAVDLVILVGGLLAGAADDQRGAGFVDQDGVNLVDDGVVVAALHAIVEIELHVVAQIVEAELVVGAVGDVGGIGRPALLVVQVVHDNADGEPQEGVELAHPLGVALGQIVVDGHDMHAAPGERVEIDRESRHQGLAFAGLHFGDLALVQHHAADQLHVEVAHVEHAPSGFAHHREGFVQNLVQHLGHQAVALGLQLLGAIGATVGVVGGILGVEFGQLLLHPGAELVGPGAQLGIAERAHLRLESIDELHPRQQPLDLAFVGGAENFGK